MELVLGRVDWFWDESEIGRAGGNARRNFEGDRRGAGPGRTDAPP